MSNTVRLRPRLQAAADLINNSKHAADIGCDHGRLSVALLQQRRTQAVTASDISEPSLEKTRQLCRICGLEDKVKTVVSDGISHLAPNEVDAFIIAGMGGELIARILSACPQTACSASVIVMQPMRGVEELRRFLRENNYCIREERLVEDAGRIYQIIAAEPNRAEEIPPWFPRDEYSLGYRLFEQRDPLLIPLLEQYRNGHIRRLEQAKGKGTSPAALLDIINRADSLIKLATEIQK